MPNIPTRVGQYCIYHGYIHEEEYLECDYCNEHKSFINLKYRYYNYGFSKHSYLACMECHSNLFGPFRLVNGDIVLRAYENIIDVIKGRSNKKSIDYYEAVRIAYTESKYMQQHFESVIKDITEINKGFKPIWEFTYRIVNEEKERVRVVNKNPDNLLVSWVPEGMTLTEILKANMI
ncbi:MAG TPA: hypothetical protein VGW09_09175 [Nitrososphaeraceae archaeon]|nr:hypothetical protein [Nitrososphaeraceae archaeon]